MTELAEQLLSNEVFSGMGAATVLAWALYILRETPQKIWTWLWWQFSCRLTIFSEDAAYEKTNEWLAALDYAKRARRLRLTNRYDYDEQQEHEVLAPGLGRHWFWYRGRPVLVDRSLPDKGGIGGWKRFEDIEIYTLGSNPKVMQELVDEIIQSRKSEQAKTVNVYLYRNRWRLACRKPKRPLGSVILPAELRGFLVEDLERFVRAKAWYQQLGVPYRRGYMLEGPPGCGKTSLALAIASHFQRPIYALNLGSLANDDELIEAVCEVPEHGILLIEDIDAAKAGKRRETTLNEAASAASSSTAAKEDAREVSLSALLNVLDGAFSREGRILLMTTNHPDKIDPALLRPGRSDCRITVGALGKPEVLAMCERFLGREDARAFAAGVKVPVAAAELQEQLVQHVRASRDAKREAA